MQSSCPRYAAAHQPVGDSNDLAVLYFILNSPVGLNHLGYSHLQLIQYDTFCSMMIIVPRHDKI
jgi:hypothetical protein